jgi:hypothetical protein
MATFMKDYSTNKPPRIEQLPVAASQDISKGDVLVLSSGNVALAGDGTGEVVGVAAEDSSNAAAGTLVEVYIAQPSQVWEVAASADASSAVRDGTATYDLNASQQVNVADTTGGSLQIVGVDDGDNTVAHVQFTVCYYS